MKIADYIPRDRCNAISRAELARRTGLRDRVIREWIKLDNRELVQEGRVILSSSGARGYWISSDPEEIAEYCRESRARQRSIYFNDRPVYDLHRQLTGQRTVTVREHQRRLSPETEIDGQLEMEGA